MRNIAGSVSAITTGFGNTLASIGIVIGLGVGIGKILEVSGAANALALAFLKLFGKGREPWAMASVGSLVSIPVFCDSGYVIMNPLARSIARVKRAGYITLALALGCGMTLTHHMVPPTPGPLAVAGILGTDLGALILAGLAFTIILLPVVVFYAKWIGPKIEPGMSETIRETVYGRAATHQHGRTTTALADHDDHASGDTAARAIGATGPSEDSEYGSTIDFDSSELGTPPAGAADDGERLVANAAFWKSLAARAAGVRHLSLPPNAGDNDIIDPYRRSPEVYRQMEDELAPAIVSILRHARLNVPA